MVGFVFLRQVFQNPKYLNSVFLLIDLESRVQSSLILKDFLFSTRVTIGILEGPLNSKLIDFVHLVRLLNNQNNEVVVMFKIHLGIQFPGFPKLQVSFFLSTSQSTDLKLWRVVSLSKLLILFPALEF